MNSSITWAQSVCLPSDFRGVPYGLTYPIESAKVLVEQKMHAIASMIGFKSPLDWMGGKEKDPLLNTFFNASLGERANICPITASGARNKNPFTPIIEESWQKSEDINSLKRYSSRATSATALSLAIIGRDALQQPAAERELQVVEWTVAFKVLAEVLKIVLKSYNNDNGYLGKIISSFSNIVKNQVVENNENIKKVVALSTGLLASQIAVKIDSMFPRGYFPSFAMGLATPLIKNITDESLVFPLILILFLTAAKIDSSLPRGLFPRLFAGGLTTQMIKSHWHPDNFSKFVSFFSDTINQSLQAIENRWDSGILEREAAIGAALTGGIGGIIFSLLSIRTFGRIDAACIEMTAILSALGAIAGALRSNEVMKAISLFELCLQAIKDHWESGVLVRGTVGAVLGWPGFAFSVGLFDGIREEVYGIRPPVRDTRDYNRILLLGSSLGATVGVLTPLSERAALFAKLVMQAKEVAVKRLEDLGSAIANYSRLI